MEYDKVGEDENEEEDLHEIHLHCTGFVFLPNNKILFCIHRQKISFVIENRDITDFLSTYFTSLFSFRLILAPLIRS